MAKRKSKSSGSLGVITLLIVILLAAGLYYLKTHSDDANKIKKQIAESTPSSKAKFDFYNVLQQGHDENTADTELSPAVNPNTAKPNLAPLPPLQPLTGIPTPTSPAAAQKYMLRVATLKNFSDADQMKAELTLLGYNVAIENINLSNQPMHRVNLGPYASLSDAQAAQADLLKNKYKSVVFKINLEKKAQ